MLSVFNDYVPLDEVPEFFGNVIRTARKEQKIARYSISLALPLMLVAAIAQMLPGGRLLGIMVFAAFMLGMAAMLFSLGAFLILDPTRHWFDERFKRFRKLLLEVLGIPYNVLAKMSDTEIRGATRDLLQMSGWRVKYAEETHKGQEYHPDRVKARQTFEEVFDDAKWLGLIPSDTTRHQFFSARETK